MTTPSGFATSGFACHPFASEGEFRSSHAEGEFSIAILLKISKNQYF
jgi:hypothetical protein